MTVPEDQYYHGGIMWTYKDNRGVDHIGHFVRASDFGGTDVPYQFKDCATGELSVVRGAGLKGAHAIDQCCATRRALLDQCAS